MIILGPRITCWGDPTWAGGAVGREDEAAWPLVVAGPLPPLRRSAIEAFSSSRSGENGCGFRSASSRVQRIALLVCFESRTAGCGGGLVEEGCCWYGSDDDGRRDDATSSGSSLSSWESCRRRGLEACSACSTPPKDPGVEKKGRGLMPIVAASRWTRRGGSDGRGLGLAEKRGVRRRVRWEDGVGDRSSR
jgi:hypothetical protein